MAEFRQSQNLTQTELAKRSGITQQQLSKLERGENCNITTFLKVCNTLGIEIMLRPPNFV
jgi:transcriptional regulator with XRE-family HTH domain